MSMRRNSKVITVDPLNENVEDTGTPVRRIGRSKRSNSQANTPGQVDSRRNRDKSRDSEHRDTEYEKHPHNSLADTNSTTHTKSSREDISIKKHGSPHRSPQRSPHKERRSPFKEQPKMAWCESKNVEDNTEFIGQVESDNEEPTKIGRKSEDHPDSRKNKHRASVDSTYESDESDMQTMLVELSNKMRNMETALSSWKKVKSTIQNKQNEIQTELDRRKRKVEEAIQTYVSSLQESLDSDFSTTLDTTNDSIETLEDNLVVMKKVFNKYSKILNNKHCKNLKDRLTRLYAKHKDVDLPDSIEPTPVQLSEIETSPEIIRVMLGIEFNLEDISSNGKSAKDGILDSPELMRTLSCRHKKDKKSCGITDIAITDTGDIIAVDKNNKLVKMYDKSSVLVRLIGKEQLRKPSRVTVHSALQKIFVTDEVTKTLHVFSIDGSSYLGEMACSIVYPVDHCETTDGQLAVLDFAKKSVVVLNSEFNENLSFPTGMQCPAYMASTLHDRLVVTDWKENIIKIFDLSGRETFSYSGGKYALPGEEGRLMDQPNGVCSDGLGTIFMADTKNHRVQMMSEDGHKIKSYDNEQHKIGSPFAVACNKIGQLALADFLGTIRIYAYVPPASPLRSHVQQ